MKLPISGDAKSYAILLGVGVAGVMVLTLFFRKQVGDAASGALDAVGGVLSGNNAITEGSVYEDKGLLGTLGASANEISGGVLERLGSRLGSAIFDVFHPAAADPNQRKLSSLAAARAVDRPGALR